MKNQEILQSIEKTATPLGFHLLIAEHQVSVDSSIMDKVVDLMETCDIALVLLTREGFDSKAVQQEIGYLQKLKKPLLLVVQKTLEKELSMFAYGRDYILLDPTDITRALDRMREVLEGFWKAWHKKRTDARLAYEKAVKEAELRKAQQEQEAQNVRTGLFAIGGLVLLSMMTSNSSDTPRPKKKTSGNKRKRTRRRPY